MIVLGFCNGLSPCKVLSVVLPVGAALSDQNIPVADGPGCTAKATFHDLPGAGILYT